MTPVLAGRPAPSASRTGSSILDAVLRFRELSLLVVLVALVAVTATANPRFLSAQSLRDLALAASITIVLATGLTLVVLTRGIDLSVGSVLGLSAFTVSSALERAPGLGVAGAIAVGLAIGAACGLVNAAVITLGGVPALVATLGTLYLFRGVGYFAAGGDQVNAADLPDAFLAFGSGRLLGVPYLLVTAVVVVVLASVLLGRYRTGRDLYAIGSNPVAARLAGVAVTRRLLLAYLACGALAGLGGVLYAARFGTVDASAGTGLELGVVAAVVVGGVAIFGGSGTAYGAALGAMVLTVISNALPALGVDQFWQQAVVGALIVGAIGVDRLVALRVAASMRRRDARA
ncbi:MAG: ABC transporter permease [Kineosporiaceae bacterium]